MSPTRTAALLLLAAAVPVFAGAAGPAPPEGTEAPPATASADLVRIDHRIVVPASRERVWEALTTPEGLARWIAPRSNVRLEIGGPYELYFRPDDPVDRGMEGTRVLSFVPYEVLSYTGEAENTWVVWRLRDLGPGEGVELRFTGIGASAEWSARSAHFDAVMPGLMEKLAASVAPPPETGEPLEQHPQPDAR
jgi:uncharacterized protein YndB with AHSA1/START domain